MKARAAVITLASALGVGAFVVPAQAAPGARVFSVGPAGSVSVESSKGRLRVADVDPSSGWKVVEARATGKREVDVTFRKGGRVLEFEANLSGGRVTGDIVRRGAPQTALMDADVHTIEAGPAGSVSVQFVDGALQIVSVTPNEGWTVTEQRSRGLEVDVEFVSDTQKVELEIDIANGELASELEIEALEGTPAEDGTFEIPAGVAGALTVSVSGDEVSLVSTAPADGWTASENESDDPNEVEVTFTGLTESVEVSVEVDDGVLEVEIEAEDDDDDDDADDDDSDDDEDGDDDDSDDEVVIG